MEDNKTLVYDQDAPHEGLKCSSCGNTTNFIEWSFRTTQQPFEVISKGGETDVEYGSYDDTDDTEYYPYMITCNGDECDGDQIVWQV